MPFTGVSEPVNIIPAEKVLVLTTPSVHVRHARLAVTATFTLTKLEVRNPQLPHPFVNWA